MIYLVWGITYFHLNLVILDGVKTKKEASETEESTTTTPQNAEQVWQQLVIKETNYTNYFEQFD